MATPSPPHPSDTAPAAPAVRARDPWWTVPNVLSAVRLLASPLLVALAWWELPFWCLALAVTLLLIDWLDGKLARWLRQQTVLGARLDSYADVTLYGCLLLALVVLRRDLITGEAVWIGLAVGSYALSVGAGLLKFRRVPSYHTRMAKVSWLLMVVAVLAVFADLSVWPLRVAMAAVTVTNLEATVMTCLLPAWRANVLSVFHALSVLRIAKDEARTAQAK